MPSLDPFRRQQPDRPSLRQRAASLKAGLGRVVQEPEPQVAPDAVDWDSPPPGFMADPVREPMSFINIPEGLRLELERLHDIACGEFDRLAGASEKTRRVAVRPEVEDRLRRRLRLDGIEAARFLEPAGMDGIAVDPVHAAIEAVRRCLLDCAAAQQLPQPPGHSDPLPEQEAAGEALHASLDALAVTVPTTAEGCALLARFAVEFQAAEGFAVDEDQHGQQHLRILDLIARSPMSQHGMASKDKTAAKWSRAQAAALDLSGCSIKALARLFELFSAATDTWSNLSCLPYVEDSTATARIVEGEYERAAFIRDRIHGLLRCRRPKNDTERDDALAVRLRYELECEMRVRDRTLLAEINAAWGARPMGDVLTFTPRPKPAAPEILAPLEGAALRASLEEAAQTALDAADRIIAVLDRMDGDADHEDGGDAKPSLAAPKNVTGSQVVYMRGNDQDREAGGVRDRAAGGGDRTSA